MTFNLSTSRALGSLSVSLLALGLLALSSAAPAFASDSEPPSPAAADALSARGVLRPGQSAEIAAAMSGRLTSAPYKAGQYFKRGAVLARFDCTRQEAELSALTQAHATLTIEHDNTRELHAAGAAGALDLSIAASKVAQAAAERDVMAARMKDCVVHAPFAGYVTTQHMRAHETPALNAPLYSIIRAGALEISVIAPSSWMRWAKPKQRFDFVVDETGETLRAEIIRLGAAVDPVSQTIEITARPLSSKNSRALSGMSGVAVFTAAKGEG